MTDNCLVSVLIPAYNAESFIVTALNSVLNQSFESLEVIVCDDGSTDTTAQKVEHYAARSSVSIVKQANRGVAAALATAFACSSGSIVCLLDADDAYLPGKIHAVVSAFRACPDAGMISHSVLNVSHRLRPLDKPEYCTSREALAIIESPGGLGPASGLAFRSDVFATLLPFPEPLATWVDGYLAGGAVQRGKTVHLRSTLAVRRIHNGNLSGSVRATRAWLANTVDAIEGVEAGLGARTATGVTKNPSPFSGAYARFSLALSLAEDGAFADRMSRWKAAAGALGRLRFAWLFALVAPRPVRAAFVNQALGEASGARRWRWIQFLVRHPVRGSQLISDLRAIRRHEKVVGPIS